MKILFDGQIDICYAQFYVASADAEQWVDMAKAFAGQRNGLCGTGQPGRLFLVTGTHTGKVALSVEYLASRPPIGETWEEQVECPFELASGPVFLRDWEGLLSHPLSLLPGKYRVRYSARCMLGDGDVGANSHVLQSYRLQFWLEASSRDKVLRAHGECAKHWHNEVHVKTS